MPAALRSYVVITAAYWSFMITDGALRMLVLLQFHLLGYSPLQLAYLFLLYEIMGVVTNLYAGWLAQKTGLLATLFLGLCLQILALFAMLGFSPDWPEVQAIVFVMLVQALSGVAKDLAKMSAKSAVKSLAPNQNDRLFRLVALLTGSKNAIKGAGFFLGATLLAVFGFAPALIALIILLIGALLLVLFLRPQGLGAAKVRRKFQEVLSRSPNINQLSLARLFLFAARDCWFVVAVPVFLYSAFASAGQIAFFVVGGFMAFWVIAYGGIQSIAPRILQKRRLSAAQLAALLCLFTLILAIAAPYLSAVQLMVALFLFGGLFALNSALHSYLVLAYSSKDQVSMDVGFYYMSNAAGRLFGTLLSGLTFQIAGLTGALFVAALLAGCSYLAARSLPEPTET